MIRLPIVLVINSLSQNLMERNVGTYVLDTQFKRIRKHIKFDIKPFFRQRIIKFSRVGRYRLGICYIMRLADFDIFCSIPDRCHEPAV